MDRFIINSLLQKNIFVIQTTVGNIPKPILQNTLDTLSGYLQAILTFLWVGPQGLSLLAIFTPFHWLLITGEKTI